MKKPDKYQMAAAWTRQRKANEACWRFEAERGISRKMSPADKNTLLGLKELGRNPDPDTVEEYLNVRGEDGHEWTWPQCEVCARYVERLFRFGIGEMDFCESCLEEALEVLHYVKEHGYEEE